MLQKHNRFLTVEFKRGNSSSTTLGLVLVLVLLWFVRFVYVCESEWVYHVCNNTPRTIRSLTVDSETRYDCNEYGGECKSRALRLSNLPAMSNRSAEFQWYLGSDVVFINGVRTFQTGWWSFLGLWTWPLTTLGTSTTMQIYAEHDRNSWFYEFEMGHRSCKTPTLT